MTKIVVLVGAMAFLGSLVACRPEWLHANAFLKNFISHELVSLLAVVLTVTLASVANIHLAINRIVARYLSHNAEQKAVAEAIKSEIKGNAWVIFYSFIAAIVILFIKGLNESDLLVVAICNAAMLWILLLNLLCILDIYRVIYGVVDLETGLAGAKGKKEDPDYTDEAPDMSQ